MKKVMMLMAVAMLVSPVFADFSAVLVDSPLANYSNGGPFDATVTGWGNFTTFCVEEVTFYPGQPYWFTIDGQIYNGGTQPNYLDDATKELYSRFLTATDPERVTYAADFQQAIWSLEGVLSTTAPASYTDGTLFTLGNDSLASRVKVLNLWGDANYTVDAQSHLILVPAPGALLLGSLGMGLVGWLRRRQAV